MFKALIFLLTDRNTVVTGRGKENYGREVLFLLKKYLFFLI